MARDTGGLFFHDDNDLTKGLTDAFSDLAGYYLIGYQADQETFESLRHNPQLHNVELNALRPGLHVRARNGFPGTPGPDDVHDSANRQSKQTEFQHALSSPFASNGFPVYLSALYSAEAQADPKTKHRNTFIRAMLAIDAASIQFDTTQDGKKRLSLQIAAVAYGSSGETAVRSDKTFDTIVAADEADQIAQSGLLYVFDVDIPKPGPYQLRIAARDALSEKIGSATAFIEVPDFAKPGLTLSSVVVDSDANAKNPVVRSGGINASNAVTRIFSPGSLLTYTCSIFGAKMSQQTGKPRIDVQIRLFRGKEQIYNGQLISLAAPNGATATSVTAAGTVRIPDVFPAGNYSMELNVFDRLGRKDSASASQWVNFSLVRD